MNHVSISNRSLSILQNTLTNKAITEYIQGLETSVFSEYIKSFLEKGKLQRLFFVCPR